MSKYSNEFKLKVIEYYLNHDYGYMKVAKYFNINHEHYNFLKYIVIQ